MCDRAGCLVSLNELPRGFFRGPLKNLYFKGISLKPKPIFKIFLIGGKK